MSFSRILREVKTADDFYCKMETLSAELLNGTLIDSNRLIHMISTLGPINDLQQLRQKHLTASYNDQKQLKYVNTLPNYFDWTENILFVFRMLYSSAESDESRMAVASAWASRRGSQPVIKGQSDREKIALDITILKKQYDKLRERQKQAHIILSSAVSKQHQNHKKGQSAAGPSNVNKLLVGKNAIVSKGRKGPPKGSIPPVRGQKLAKIPKAPPKQTQIKPDETLHWSNTDEAKKRRNSMTWKELNAERKADDLKTITKSSSASSLTGTSKTDLASSYRRSDSSSYSEDSDGESSPSTSLCDDDITSSLEASPMKKKRHKDLPLDVSKKPSNMKTIIEVSPPTIDVADCPVISISCVDSDIKALSPIANFYLDLSGNGEGGDITSTSQLSPMPDISSYFTAISPITTPCDFFEFPDFSSFIMCNDEGFRVNEDGVTNEFFERTFEENNLSCNAVTPDNSSGIMSKSFSPSILKSYEKEENSDEYKNEMKDLSKYIKQKSLSMDEQSHDKEECVAINRSYSDGTIISTATDTKSDGFQKIISENFKILNKLIPRATNSPDNLVETHYTKLNVESVIIEEPKSPNNLSDVEEEIAAIDMVDEAEEAKEGVMMLSDISDIQDLANIEAYTGEKTSAKVDPLTCHTDTEDENVTERKEKSINDEHEALATLACSSLENISDVDGEVAEIKALTVSADPPKVEVRPVEVKCESPTSASVEIQLMVTKLKEEMESQLKSSESDFIKKATAEKFTQSDNDAKPTDNSSDRKCDGNCAKNDKVQIPKIEISDEPVKLPESSLEIAKASEAPIKTSDVPEKASEVKPNPPVEELKNEIDQNYKKNSATTVDLEKVASSSVQKIDKSDSDVILKKLNTQLDICHQPQVKEAFTSTDEKNMSDTIQVASKVNYNESKSDLEVKCENEAKVLKDSSVQSEMSKATVDISAVEVKKNSNEIIENLNIQLQRYDKSNAKVERKNDTYETSAVMELATLIKERELEKLSEQKLLMKTSKDFDFELNLSPVRTPKARSTVSSPEPSNNIKINNYFYDHEPRNDNRRCNVNTYKKDVIATLETEQRLRRPFKSSPTGSLSSSPSNISNTLSSIQNTIKILDSACQKTDAVNSKPTKYGRAMENIEKICDTDKEWKYYKKNKYDSSPSFKIDDVSFDSHQSKRRPLIDDEKDVERSFDLSPRRNRYDYGVAEVSFKSSRDVSPTRFSAKTPEIDPDYVAKLRYLSTEDYIAGRKSPLGGSRERLDTKFKIDRSPTSPTLSTHFSRPPRSPSSSLLKFPSSDNRSSKSAENSPSRYSNERVESSGYKYNSASGTIDAKADSMSNLSHKPNRKYDYDWETPSNKKKYDFY